MYKYLLSWKAKWSWTNHSEFEWAIISLSSQKNALSLLLICRFKKGHSISFKLCFQNIVIWQILHLLLMFIKNISLVRIYMTYVRRPQFYIPTYIWEHEFYYFGRLGRQGSNENFFNINKVSYLLLRFLFILLNNSKIKDSELCNMHQFCL